MTKTDIETLGLSIVDGMFGGILYIVNNKEGVDQLVALSPKGLRSIRFEETSIEFVMRKFIDDTSAMKIGNASIEEVSKSLRNLAGQAMDVESRFAPMLGDLAEVMSHQRG